MSRRLSPLLATCFMLAAATLSGCADYKFTVNDQVVYNPAPLFKDFDVPDAPLRDCLKQHIADASVTAADQLTELNCSHAGVASLEGLQVFTRLVRLKLSNNAIDSVVPLANTVGLKELYLDGNQLRNIMPLRGLPELEYLNLGQNADLVCMQLDFFKRKPRLELVSPGHCPG